MAAMDIEVISVTTVVDMIIRRACAAVHKNNTTLFSTSNIKRGFPTPTIITKLLKRQINFNLISHTLPWELSHLLFEYIYSYMSNVGEST